MNINMKHTYTYTYVCTNAMIILALTALKSIPVQSFFIHSSNGKQSLKLVPYTASKISQAQQSTSSCLYSSFKPQKQHTSLSSLSDRVCVALSHDIDHRNVSFDLASSLGLPILNDENTNTISEYDNGNALKTPTGSESKPISASIQSDNPGELYDHCIHISPYQYQSIETYAIAIQPMKGSGSGSGNSKSGRRGKRQKNSTTMQPFYIDFCPPPNSKLGKRLGNQKGSESLLKAVAPVKMGDDGVGAVIFDLNAGFGQDSIIMALGGASRVHMVERDPIVGLLLSDAMRRLELVSSLDIIDENDNNNYQEITRAKNLFNTLVLHQDDSVAFSKAVRLSSSNNDGVDVDVDIPRPDVCYLDPMFPPRTKSSAVKKNMQILHGLFENKDNEEKTDRIKEEQDLLIEALMLAKKRVVVKRPVTAFPLGIEKDIDAGIKMPSYELKGSVNRFDVYVI